LAQMAFSSSAGAELLDAQSVGWTLGAAGLAGSSHIAFLYAPPEDQCEVTPGCRRLADHLDRNIQAIALQAAADDLIYTDSPCEEEVIFASTKFVAAMSSWLKDVADHNATVSLVEVGAAGGEHNVISDQVIARRRRQVGPEAGEGLR
jgi:hypothetical protein